MEPPETIRAEIPLPGPAATEALGTRLAALLRAGDTVLLSGPIGAGKSHLARAILQARMRREGAPVEDVPSPTYTLVQPYALPGGEVWHADLYRLSGPEEAVELGLDTAFGTVLCLVEWPDRLGDLAPAEALRIALAPEGEGRRATLCARDPRWATIVSRAADGCPA